MEENGGNISLEMEPTWWDHTPLVLQRPFERLYRVVMKAMEEGLLQAEHGLYAETVWIHTTLNELEELEDLTRGVIEGDGPSISRLLDVLAHAPRWPLEKSRTLPEPQPGGFLPDCLLNPIHPAILISSGLILNRLEPEGAGGPWLERAMGFYLSKSAPVRGAFYAAERVLRDEGSMRDFADLFMSAREAISPHTGSGGHDMSGEHDVGMPHELAAAHDLPFGPEKWDPCTLNWGLCTGIIGPPAATEMRVDDVPVLVGRVEPDAICQGYTGTLTLYPRLSGQFPTPQPLPSPNEGLVLADGVHVYPLTVVPGGWKSTSITVDFPQGVASGCAQIYWKPPASSLPERLGNASDCANLMGITPVSPPITVIHRSRALLAVGGTPRINWFRAVGQSTLAEACTDVELEWNIQAGVCLPYSGTVRVQLGRPFPHLPGPGRAKVSLYAGSQLLSSDLPLAGELIVNERSTVIYTLSVESFADTILCGDATATVTVSRVSRILLSAPDRVFHPSRTIPVTVRLNCPAPPGGLSVDLISSDLAALASGTVVIPEGTNEMTVALGPPQVPVRLVKLTAAAQGYVGESVNLMIHFKSCIPPSFAASQARYGGKWDIAATIPGVIGIHLAVLHTGKVLLFSYDEGPNPQDFAATSLSLGDANKAKCAVWDPQSGSIHNIVLNRNLFCSGHCFIGDGQLFVAAGQFPTPLPFSGANRDLHLFNPVSETWSRLQPDMAQGRWYPTCVALADGRVMVISGNDAMFAGAGGIQNSLQLFDPANMAATLPTEALGFNIYHLFPFAYALPSGEVLVHWKRTTALYNPTTHAWKRTGWPLFQAGLGETRYQFSRTGPGPGTSVLLPFLPKRDPQTGAVTYPSGKILILGGGGAEGEPDPKVPGEVYRDANNNELLNVQTPATNTAEILDLDDPYPQQWRWTGRDQANPSFMMSRRVMPDSVLLPDGKILVVNGAEFGRSGGFLIHFGASWGATNQANEPEIFDPESETWETMCPSGPPRLYHATAALLPDGRVVVAGHDGFLNAPPFQTSEYRLEVFSPPYLFRGPRPQILVGPGTLSYNSVFYIDTNDAQAVASVALIRQSSVTHQTNTDQRYIRLAIEAISDPKRIWLKAPPNGVVPPGYYMLFIVSHDGVPSVAHWVRLA